MIIVVDEIVKQDKSYVYRMFSDTDGVYFVSAFSGLQVLYHIDYLLLQINTILLN